MGTYSHGDILAWGHPACELGSRSSLGAVGTFAPQAGIADIVCGHYNTAVITDDGRLFACGRNDSGLLGDSKPKRVTSLVEIRLGGYRCRAVAIGAKHALALVEKA